MDEQQTDKQPGHMAKGKRRRLKGNRKAAKAQTEVKGKDEGEKKDGSEQRESRPKVRSPVHDPRRRGMPADGARSKIHRDGEATEPKPPGAREMPKNREE